MPPKRKSGAGTEPTNPGNVNITPVGDGKRPKTDIPRQLPRSENHSAKTYLFIAEMEKLDNFKVLFGKKDKSDVCLRLSLCPFG
jgi:hypothetical protein